MKFAIIVGKKDLAGMNIKECLEKYDLNKYDAKLFEVEKESIFCENIDKEIEADFFIFATKHKSESKKKTLCCHIPGNWGKAEMGGKDKTLCMSNASFLKETFLELNNLNKSEYEVTVETDHHGPLCNKQIMFIEIGSSLKEWQDPKAGELIARVIINVLKKLVKEYKTVILLGGQHYNQTANKILLRTNYAISHICPKYQLEYLNEELMKQAIDKTVEEVDFVLLDWKGLGKEKARIKALLEKLKLPYKRTDKI